MSMVHDLDIALDVVEVMSTHALSLWPGSDRVDLSTGQPWLDSDHETEARAVDRLRQLTGGDGIFAEEGHRWSGTSNRRWIIDPIDGTAHYRAGRATWRVHLALEDPDGTAVAVVSWPSLGLWWWATRGGGTHEMVTSGAGQDQRRLGVSTTPTLDRHRIEGVPGSRPMDATTHAYPIYDLLHGELDGHLASYGDVWDHAPLTLLVEEAGGRWSDLRGRRVLGGGGMAYSNSLVHEALLAAQGGVGTVE